MRESLKGMKLATPHFFGAEQLHFLLLLNRFKSGRGLGVLNKIFWEWSVSALEVLLKVFWECSGSVLAAVW